MLHDYGSRDKRFIDMNRRVRDRLAGLVGAGYTTIPLQGSGSFVVEAMVGSPDGERQIASVMQGSAVDPEALGLKVAESLLNQGAAEILAAVDG